MTALFKDFPISELSLSALEAVGITETTSVQEKSLRPMLEWKDMIAQAPTGTGKTYAYGLPIVEHWDAQHDNPQALILSPTRELAQQIDVEMKILSSTRPDFKSLVIYGGQNLAKQRSALKDNPAVVIATPGRLIDHLKRRNIDLSSIRTLILDEADRMLDMGFIDDVRYIMDKVPRSAQIGLFSATLSREVLDISWIYQKSPAEIKVEAKAVDKPDIREYYAVANGGERILAIRDILKQEGYERALVFVNMKQSADIAARKLRDEGFSADALQGDLPQSKRNRVMRAFRESDVDILVATDVAARGLDIDDVEIVFNYDLPPENENYIHRIGRTGRAGRSGMAVSFIAPGTEAEFDAFCRKLHISPQKYDWVPPQAEEAVLSKEAEAEVIARIRKNSKWLKQDKADLYDPLASQNKRGRRRPPRNLKDSGRPAKDVRSGNRRRGRGRSGNAKG